MTKLNDLSTSQIQRIIAIKEQIAGLQDRIDSIVAAGSDGGEIPAASAGAKLPRKKHRRMSAAGRAAIAAGARARWAKIKRTAVPKAEEKLAAKKRKKFSAAARAKIAAAARARWAKAKAAGKTTL